MRINLCLGVALMASLAACGNDGGNTGGDSGLPDAMPDAGDVIDPPARGFQIVSPDIDIPAFAEITYCYYFRTPNPEPLVIKKWSSVMSPGSHNMIMFTTPSEAMPAGTVDECGGFNLSNFPSWTYAAQNSPSELVLPTDDGTGTPLGQDVAAGTPAYFQMHYLNPNEFGIKAHVTLNADAYEVGATYTKTAAFVTYNNNISVPPGATNDVESMTCTTPANAKFWMMSTHAHKQATKTQVKRGLAASTEVAFESFDWEHPGTTAWMTTPFYSFATSTPSTTNKLTYACTYNNTGSNAGTTVTSGPSAETDEMCMATGYYFPATRPLFCFNNLGPF